MKDRFDENIGKAIKESVDNMVHEYQPEHWALLLNKEKPTKNRAFIIWKWAAVVVFLLLAGSMINYFIKNEPSTIQEVQENNTIAKDSIKVDSIQHKDPREITDLNIQENKESTSDQINNESDKRRTIHYSEKINKPVDRIAEMTQSKIEGIKNGEEKVVVDSLVHKSRDDRVAIKMDTDDLRNVNDALTNLDSLEQGENDERILTQERMDSIVLANKNRLAEEMLNPELEEEEQDTKRNIKVGLNVASIFNSNQAANSSYTGFSGGISMDFPISERFDIATGINYANENVNLATNSQIPANYVSAKGTEVLRSREVVLKGIDIPLNMKYSFKIAKKNIFVSAGFSSTKYFKEDLISNYLVTDRSSVKTTDFAGNNIVQYELIQKNEEVVDPAENNAFSLANTLNFSFGVELPIPNWRQSLILEPYFKYALKPVTVQKVDYSKGGIRLRLLFDIKKN